MKESICFTCANAYSSKCIKLLTSGDKVYKGTELIDNQVVRCPKYVCDTLTKYEIAELLNISPRTVWRLSKDSPTSLISQLKDKTGIEIKIIGSTDRSTICYKLIKTNKSSSQL